MTRNSESYAAAPEIVRGAPVVLVAAAELVPGCPGMVGCCSSFCDLSEVPPILGTASEIRDGLTNLIFNAVDAMPNGGALSLRTTLTEFTEDTAPQDLAP